jgi:hypothetical protein
MDGSEIEFIISLLEKVVISGGTLIFVDWVSDVIIDYSGAKTHPGMKTMPKPYELGCKCSSCYDGFTVKTRADFEMDAKDWEEMVLNNEESKYDPKTGKLRENNINSIKDK